MPSKTSFFSKALFINNLKRFWPILAGYGLAVLFALSSQLVNYSHRMNYYYSSYYPGDFSQMALELIPFWVCIIPLAIIAVSGGVWSYMYRSPSTAMINALPVNRKTVFYSNYISGLFILLVPIALAAIIYLIAGAALGLTGIMAGFWPWLLMIVSVTLLLFSLASALAMTTGNLPTLVVLFSVANFLLIFLETMIRYFLETYLYGMVGLWGQDMLFAVATPLYWLADATNDLRYGYADHTWSFVIYLLVGLGLMVIGRVLYQRRCMERATDVIAIRALYPVFIYGVALCCSLSFGNLLAEILFNPSWQVSLSNFAAHLACFIFTGVIGYFVALMLLHKSFKVFNIYKGALVYSLVLILAGCSIYYDFYGYASYTPESDKVVAVAVATGNSDYYSLLKDVQAEPDDTFYIDHLPAIPPELALRLGAPLPEDQNSQNAYYYGPSANYSYYDGEKNYSYQRQYYSLLTAGDLQWLWESQRDIYTRPEGIALASELQNWLNDNLSELRADFRRPESNYPANILARETIAETYQENLYIAWRLENGQTVMRHYPVIINTAAYLAGSSELASRLDELMSLEENRAQLLAYTQIPAPDLTEIHLDLGSLYYSLYGYDENEKNEYYYKMKDMEYAMGAATPVPVPTTMEEDSEVASQSSIFISPADYPGFMAAWAADLTALPGYLTYQFEPRAYDRYDNATGSLRLNWTNRGVPDNNRYYAGGYSQSLNRCYPHTLAFLQDRGYISDEFYQDILSYYGLQAPQGT